MEGSPSHQPGDVIWLLSRHKTKMTPRALRKLARKGRHFELTWRYLFNLQPTLSYKFSDRSVEGEAARVLKALNREGVAMTSAEALLGPGSCYHELCSTVEDLQATLAAEIIKAQTSADEAGAVGEKKFILEYLGRNPRFDSGSVYARFALQRNILGIANAYLGMRSRLRYYNVWHTLPTKRDPRESQLWHRDREDYLIVKVFLYLCDVGDGAGPFTYAPSTHPKGNFRSEAAYSLEGNVRRSTDDQMADVISPQKWFKGVGPKGTIIFADTRGYHRGGLAREQARVMYTAMFTSQASESEEFMRDGPAAGFLLDSDQAFAVSRTNPRDNGN